MTRFKKLKHRVEPTIRTRIFTLCLIIDQPKLTFELVNENSPWCKFVRPKHAGIKRVLSVYHKLIIQVYAIRIQTDQTCAYNNWDDGTYNNSTIVICVVLLRVRRHEHTYRHRGRPLF